MKFFIPLSCIALLFCCLTACHKSGGSNTPTPVDTLGAWQKVSTNYKGFSDIWFTTPTRGIAAGDLLYNTSDSGKTWTAVAGVQNGINIHALGTQRGAVLNAQQIYLTDDFINWRQRAVPSISNGAPDLQFTSLSTCYISSYSGLYKTTDTANTWTKVYGNAVNGMFFFDNNTGIIYDYTATTSSNVYKTVDGGAHWQVISYIPGKPNSYNTMQFVNTQTGWLSRGDSLFSTTDGGTTWSGQKSPGGGIVDIQFLDTKIGYIACYGEIYKTTDGGQTWTRSCKLAKEQLVEIFFIDEKTGWACGGGGSILRLKQ